MKPYYNEDGITIYHGDCREILPLLHYDLCITDPPYGATVFAWDQWFSEWLGCLSCSSLWCFGMLRLFMEHSRDFSASDWKLSQDVIWQKHNGSNFHADRFRRIHEQVAHFYKGEWSLIFKAPQFTADATTRTLRRKFKPQHMRHIEEGLYVSVDGGPRRMRSVIEVRSCHGTAQHPCQKPTGIIKPLIEYSCPPGGVIVDPFSGSGSIALAAKQGGHRAIGIEIDEHYCEIAANRLAQKVMVYQ